MKRMMEKKSNNWMRYDFLTFFFFFSQKMVFFPCNSTFYLQIGENIVPNARNTRIFVDFYVF